jgi:ATP-dependent Clp protease adaptor protein ClpS
MPAFRANFRLLPATLETDRPDDYYHNAKYTSLRHDSCLSRDRGRKIIRIRYTQIMTQPDKYGPFADHSFFWRPRLADDDRKRKSRDDGPGTAVITKTKPQTKRPSLYRVLLLNDDYTPMEFVVHVLERFFNKDREAATRIMLHVHHHGIGECGIFTYEVAETKVTQVMDFARKHQHPLQCVMEKK